MSQGLGSGVRERRAGAAGCRGRDRRAGAGWGGEHGSWVNEVEAHGTDQGPRWGVGERAPAGQRMTWLLSCGGG